MAKSSLSRFSSCVGTTPGIYLQGVPHPQPLPPLPQEEEEEEEEQDPVAGSGRFTLRRQPVSDLRDNAESSQESQLTLQDLPQLVLLKVMSYLTVPDLVLGMRQTCQCLNTLTHDPSLWRGVEVSSLSRFRLKPIFSSQLLMQRCFLPWKKDGDPLEDVVSTLDEDTSPENVTPKYVKDYIQSLSVTDQPLHPLADTYTYGGVKQRSRQKEVTCSAIFAPDTPVCPGLRVLKVTCISVTSTFLTTIRNHTWLTHLSVRLAPGGQRQSVQKVGDDQLLECYKAFKTLKNLKTFEFVFPISKKSSNSPVRNNLFLYSDGVHREVLQFFKAVTGLEDVVVSGVGSTVLETILYSCRRLRSLTFSSHHLSPWCFQCTDPLSSLESLTIGSTLSCLTSEMATHVAQAFPSLKAVNFTDLICTDQGLATLLQKCRGLESLHLDCRSTQGMLLSNATALYASSVLSHLSAAGRTPLRELSIRTQLDDDTLHTLCAHSSTLTSISLTDCEDITDASLATIAQLCPKLLHLSLRQNHSHLSARSLLRLIRKCQGLASLHVESTSNKGRFVPLTDRENVCGQCSSPDQQKVAPWTEFFTSSGTQPPHSATPQAPGKKLPRCYHSKMQTIHLGRIPQMTAEDMNVLVHACPNLVELELRGCLRLDDSAVAVIARGCPVLTSLTLDRRTCGVTYKPCHVTDRALNFLTQHASCLQHLQALYCYRFSAPALAEFLVHSRAVKSVVVTEDKLHRLCGFQHLDASIQQALNTCCPPKILQMDVRYSKPASALQTRLMTLTILRKQQSKITRHLRKVTGW